jgi:parallel beta-helix repeat protein
MGNSNNITGNRVVNSYEGIIFNYGENNRLVGNTIENNSNGIALYSSNNLVYLNYFINDSAFNSEVTNFWDNGSVGNFWSDYQTKYPNATKVDGSGIGNTTYVIDANNIDHYPLMPQANIPTPTPSVSEFPLLAILPLFLSVLLAAMILRNRKTTK